MIREFWSELVGSVHPADQPVFDAHPGHSFNLDFPPPAFVGEPNAPVVMLMANGGYKPDLTPSEFAAPDAAEVYRNGLRGLSSAVPACYENRGLGLWAREGLAVLVNAVAYRSVGLSKEPNNQLLARRLPSFDVHQRWVREVVLPDARAGRRFLIVHRNGLWRLAKEEAATTIVFSRNPISSAPARDVMDRVEQWLEATVGRPARTAAATRS